MKLCYFDVPSNFGDALDPWLWPQLLGPRLAAEPATLFIGIGTVLNQRRLANFRRLTQHRPGERAAN